MSLRVSPRVPAWLEVGGWGGLLWEGGLEVRLWEGVPCSVDPPRGNWACKHVWSEADGRKERGREAGQTGRVWQPLRPSWDTWCFEPSRFEHVAF